MNLKGIEKKIVKMVLGEEASTTIEKNEKSKKLENLYSECKKLEYEIHTKETCLKYDIRELNFDIEMAKSKVENISNQIALLEKEIRSNSKTGTVSSTIAKNPTTFTLDGENK